MASFKADVKRVSVDLSHIETYFEALRVAIAQPETSSVGSSSLHSYKDMAYSTMFHLIKRLSSQSSDGLKACAHIAMPLLLQRLADQRQSSRSTARVIFLEYWRSCPGEGDVCLRNVGFEHSNEMVRSESVKIVYERLTMETFAFRSFTPSMVRLLADRSQSVSEAAQGVIVLFFSNAPVRAKMDIQRELKDQGVNNEISNTILKQIGMLKSIPGRESPALPSMPSSLQQRHPQPFKLTTSSPSRENSRYDPQFSANSRAIASGAASSSTSSPRVLDVLWATNQLGYAMENLSPEYVDSAEHLEDITEQMLPYFAGKETEHNWQYREKSIKKFRALLRGNAVASYKDQIIAMLRELSDGICKAASSLRTSLSSNGCGLIKDAAIILKHDMVIEPFLTTSVRLSMGAKKITAQQSSVTIIAMLINSTYTSRYLTHCQQVMAEKIPQAKVYCASWLRLIICCHHTSKYLDESILEHCLIKALSDANPLVRESMRQVYWDYFEIRPLRAKAVFKDLDANVRKALDRANPSLNSVRQNSSTLQKISNAPGALRFAKTGRHALREQPSSQTNSERPSPMLHKTGFSRLQLSSAGSSVAQTPSLHVERPPSQPSSGFDRRIENIFDSSQPERNKNDRELLFLSQETSDSQLSLKEMLIHSDGSIFQRGVNILISLMKEGDISSSNNSLSPVQLPPTQVIEGALIRAFQHSQSYVYVYPSIVGKLCSPDLVESTIKYVSGQNLIEGIAFCAYSASTFQSNISHISKHINTSDMFYHICFLANLLKTYAGTEQVSSCFEVLKAMANELDAKQAKNGLYLLAELGRAYTSQIEDITTRLKQPSSPLQISIEARETNDSDLKDAGDEEIVNYDGSKLDEPHAVTEDVFSQPEIVNAQTRDEDMTLDIAEASISMLKHSNDEERSSSREKCEEDVVGQSSDMHSQENEGTSLEKGASDNEQSLKEDTSIREQSLHEENADDELLVVSSQVDEKLVTDELSPKQIKQRTSEQPVDIQQEEAVQYASSSDVEIVEEGATAEDDVEVTQTRITAMDIDAKENVEPISHDQHKVPTADSMSKTPLTPSKASNGQFQTPERATTRERRDEAEHIMKALSPLPQSDEEAHNLFDRLVSEVAGGRIDVYGCRKLSMVVRRARTDGSEPAHKVWRKERWLVRLQDSLIQYFMLKSLDETQLGYGLMLLSGMLEYEPEAFDGQECELLRSLAESTNTPCAAKVGLSKYASIEEALLRRCEQDEDLRHDFLSSIVTNFGFVQSTLGVLLLMELLSNVLELLPSSDDLQSVLLPKIVEEIVKNIADTNSAKRYKAYTALEALKGIYGQDSIALRESLQGTIDAQKLNEEGRRTVSHCIPLSMK